MGKKPYSLLKRSLSSGRHVYYVHFRKEDGAFGTAKSTSQTTKTAGEAWAIKYLSSGQIVQKENLTFANFSKGFFEIGSDYRKHLTTKGKTITIRHAGNQQAIVNNHLLPVFGKLKLTKIDTKIIDAYTHNLIIQEKSSSTINHILGTFQIILKFADRFQLIQRLPIIDFIPNRSKERGILAIQEAQDFFSKPWSNVRYYAINLIAATTGMRMGEIRALKRSVIHKDYIEVNVSWEKGVGLKSTKTGINRNVPLPPQTNEVLQEVMNMSPYTEPNDLIFFGRKRENPLDHRAIQRNFYQALEKIGIDEDNRKERNIVFHSWRHFYNSLLVDAKISTIKIQAVTGHSSDKMTQNYYHPKEFTDIIKAVGRIK